MSDTEPSGYSYSDMVLNIRYRFFCHPSMPHKVPDRIHKVSLLRPLLWQQYLLQNMDVLPDQWHK